MQKEHGEDESEATAPRSINAAEVRGSGRWLRLPWRSSPCLPQEAQPLDEPDEGQKAICRSRKTSTAHLFSIDSDGWTHSSMCRGPEESERKFRGIANWATDSLNGWTAAAQSAACNQTP